MGSRDRNLGFFRRRTIRRIPWQIIWESLNVCPPLSVVAKTWALQVPVIPPWVVAVGRSPLALRGCRGPQLTLLLMDAAADVPQLMCISRAAADVSCRSCCTVADDSIVAESRALMLLPQLMCMPMRTVPLILPMLPIVAVVLLAADAAAARSRPAGVAAAAAGLDVRRRFRR